MLSAAGIVSFAIGLAALSGLVPALRDVTYPLLWWGLLIVVDEWNWRRRRLSLWRENGRAFFAITLPISALLWLLFELLNLPQPEWIYRGGFHSIGWQAALGLASFTTVVPIEIEAWWVVRGEVCFAACLLGAARRLRWIFAFAGIAAIALPFIQRGPWYWNQAMWIAPAFLLLPLVPAAPCSHTGRWLGQLCLSAMLAGFVWECLNWRSHAHWQYLILRSAPHLFQMPLAGYIGFVPFALTCLTVYEACRALRGRLATGVLLWGLAIALMAIVTQVYFERGIWRP